MRKPAKDNAKTLTEAQLAVLKENAAGILSEARKTVLNRFPFIGSVALSLDLVPTRDCRVATMATDGKSIYCDIDFLSTLSNDDKVFILAHEVYHNVMLHMIRLSKGYDHNLANIATDMEVNNILREDGLSVPRDATTSDKYGFKSGLSAEEYYDLLVQRQKLQKFDNSHTKGGAGNGNADGSGNESEPDDSKDNGSGNKDGEMKGQIDKHIYKDEEVEKKGDETKADKYGKVGYDPDFMPNVTQQNVERIREAAVAAAQQIERTVGTLPGHLQKIVKQLLAPQLDWKEVLAKYVLKTGGESERTWNRPNRRFAGRGLYLPASQTNSIKIAVGIDTSGSVEQFSDRFISELNGIISSFGDYEVHCIQCDFNVQSYEKFDNVDNPLDFAKFTFKGFGGTRLQPIFDYVKDAELDVSCIVMLTDGEVSDNFKPEDAPDIPVLWCVTKGGRKDMLKFGEVCDLELE